MLSTTRWAYDLGYRVVVVSDGCSDPDRAVHQLLTAPVHPDSWVGLWRLGDIITAQATINALRPPA